MHPKYTYVKHSDKMRNTKRTGKSWRVTKVDTHKNLFLVKKNLTKNVQVKKSLEGIDILM